MSRRGIVLLSSIIMLFLSLSAHAVVTGTITDTSGSPVAGATVSFTDEADPEQTHSTVTDQEGWYEVEITPVGVGENTPFTFSLSQNRPNPFNPSTVIPFSLAKAGQVELTVFNIAGQRVKTLVSGSLPEGYHAVVWKGDDNRGGSVASGVYFYRLVSGGRAVTRKMLLLDGGSAAYARGKLGAGSAALKAAAATYTVTITGDSIEPFEQAGVAVEDGDVRDFTVQRRALRVPADYPTIAGAVSAASAGGTVLVAAGTYEENIVIDKPLTLRGEGMWVTTIKGREIPWGEESDPDPTVHITGSAVTLSGFTITGGYPGVRVDGETVVLEENHITSNRAVVGEGKIFCEMAGQNGLGVLVTGDGCTIRRNLIVHNGETFDGEGAGIKAISVKSLLIESNTICDNSGGNGAWYGNGYGVYAADSEGTLINNIIADNDAWDGPNAGILGYGVYVKGNSLFSISYNNVWSNDNDATRWDENEVDEVINYYGVQPGAHDISRDPLFVDRERYELQQKSPCIDAGDPESDFSLEPAPNGGRINLGAYGNTVLAAQTALLADAGEDRNVFFGTAVVLDGNGVNPFGGPLSYQWSIVVRPGGSTAVLSDSTAQKPEFTPDVEGVYTFRLVVGDGALESDPDMVTITAHRSGFSEDFSDGSADGWKPVTGTWTVAGGYYTVSSSGNKTSTSYYDQSFDNFEIEAKIRKTVAGQATPTDNVGVYFLGNPGTVSSDGNWKNGYCLVCGSGDWNLSRYSNGNWSSVVGWTASSQLQNSLGVWIVLKIRYLNGQAQIYINGVLQRTVNNLTTFTSGKVGLKLYDAGAVGKGEIDYVTVTPIID